MEKAVFLLIAVTFFIFGLSFIFSAEWWRKYELRILRVHEEMLGKLPLIGKLIKKDARLIEGNFGLWIFRSIGLIWIIIAFSYSMLLFL